MKGLYYFDYSGPCGRCAIFIMVYKRLNFGCFNTRHPCPHAKKLVNKLNNIFFLFQFEIVLHIVEASLQRASSIIDGHWWKETRKHQTKVSNLKWVYRLKNLLMFSAVLYITIWRDVFFWFWQNVCPNLYGNFSNLAVTRKCYILLSENRHWTLWL